MLVNSASTALAYIRECDADAREGHPPLKARHLETMIADRLATMRVYGATMSEGERADWEACLRVLQREFECRSARERKTR